MENDRNRGWAGRLRALAFALLLACVAGRVFISEMPFRRNPVQMSALLTSAQRGEETSAGQVDNLELARATFAVILLAAAATWLLAGALEGELRLSAWPLGLLALAWAGWSFVSAYYASDRPSAWLAWLEQVSLVSAGLLSLQLCRSRRRRLALVVVLAAVGVTLAVKGVAQVGWEQPDSLRYFQEYGQEQLANQGIRPDEPEAKAFEARIRDAAPVGWLGLANLFGIALGVTLGAALGLAAAKFAYARFRRQRDEPLRPGELRPATVAAWLTLLLGVLIAVILALTRSRGAVGAAALVAAATAGLWRFRDRLARHWRWTAAAAVALVAAGCLAAVGYGLAKDRLPMKTLSVRWFYWTGGARIIREHPWLGVGPGNFAQAYLQVRRPEAEEAVKTPHNFLVHAPAQYGLPGGVLYVGLVLGILLLAWRPAAAQESPDLTTRTAKQGFRLPWALVLVVLAVGLSRWCFGGIRHQPILWLFECVLPVAVLAVALAAMRWFGGPLEDVPDRAMGLARVGLAAGATALAIDSLVSYGLWMPGVAMLFWAAAGAAADGGKEVRWRMLRWPVAALGVAAVIAAGTLVLRPVWRRMNYTEKLAEAMLRMDSFSALQAAQAAAQADPADGIAAQNVARVYLVCERKKIINGLPAPLFWAEEAIRRNPRDAGAYRLAAETARELRSPREAAYWQQAIQRDPAEAGMRLDYAAALMRLGRKQEAQGQIAEALRIHERLRDFDPNSVYLFGPAERQYIEDLQRQIAKPKGDLR